MVAAEETKTSITGTVKGRRTEVDNILEILLTMSALLKVILIEHL
jgi:hypothetical protein